MNSGRVNKELFLVPFGKKGIGHSWEANITAGLLEKLWQCRSIDEMESIIQQELTEGHDGYYIWGRSSKLMNRL